MYTLYRGLKIFELSSLHDHAAAIFDYDRNVMVNFTTLFKNT